MKVYLAGPMTGCHIPEAVGKRRGTASLFKQAGWEVRDPTRGETIEDTAFDALARHSYAPPRAVFNRDVADVRWCDVLFVDLVGARTVSIGTMCEIGMAYALGKYIVVVDEPGSRHNHLFVRQAASIMFAYVDDAIRYLTEVYGG